MKRTLFSSVFIVLMFSLISCESATSQPTDFSTTETVATSTSVPITPSLTQTPQPVFDGIRMAYIIEGNLYVQNSGGEPIQLTNSGADYLPMFSDDGEKITFFRGMIPHALFSINSDGSQEQELVTGAILAELDTGYGNLTEVSSLSFIPDSHQLVFNTHELDPRAANIQDMYYQASKPNKDLLLVDTNTAEINRVVDKGNGGIFQISPDGQFIGIQAIDHVEVIKRDGKAVNKNLATYPTAWQYLARPDIYWAGDSSILNITLPIPTGSALDSTGPELRTILQVCLDCNDNQKSEIHLKPPPLGDSFSISPDDHWIVYTYYYYEGKTDPSITPGIYLGNLKENTSMLLADVKQLNTLPEMFYWNSDSTTFIFEDLRSDLFLGNIDRTIVDLNKNEFHGWIDKTHYLYGSLQVADLGQNTSLTIIDLPKGIKYMNLDYFTYIFLQ
jgi:hypothetical protein